MKRKRARRGFALRELHAILNEIFPESIQCFAFQFASDGCRWRACTATHDHYTHRSSDGIARENGIAAWTSQETYPDQFSALCAAYRHARRTTSLEWGWLTRFSKN